MKDSAVFIIINMHKLDFVLLLLNTIIQHTLQVACKSKPKWNKCLFQLWWLLDKKLFHDSLRQSWLVGLNVLEVQ